MTPTVPTTSTAFRRYVLGGSVALLAASSVVVWRSGHSLNRESDATVALARGVSFADSLAARLGAGAPAGVSETDALAALYFERVRLGLGSPFRTAEYALRDKDLPAATRRPVAMAILAQALVGDAYRTPVEAFAVVAGSNKEVMLAHRAFIESAIDTAEDPRTAEIALRYAYQIAIAGGKVSTRGNAVVVTAIAQARDRALARRDVGALVAEARRLRMDALDLIPVWRVARRFAVERPLQDPPGRDEDRAAVRMLPAFVKQIAELGSSGVSMAISNAHEMRPEAWDAAERVVVRRNSPPQAPVVVPLGGFASYVNGGAASRAERAATQRFLQTARNEESLVAGYRRLTARFAERPQSAIALLNVAVSLRTYAQERTWFPADPGLSSVELEARYRLGRVTFDDRTPHEWRTYYTRMLADAIDDMRRVLPAFDVSGLRIHFGETPLKEKALALHDPLSRTVFFPLATGAGAIAHELSHDLDWQAARRVDVNRLGYHSDLDARARLRSSAANGSLRAEPKAVGAPDRPTEQFARKADWLVASALARSGRLNGYLSAFQDSWIPGYASAVAPRRDLPGRDATLATLRSYTPVEPAAVAAVEHSLDSEQRVGVNEMLRRTLLAPMPRWDQRRSAMAGFDAFTTVPRTLRVAPELSGRWTCLLDSRIPTRDQSAVIVAMSMAAEARVDQLLSRWESFVRNGPSSGELRGLGRAPWSPSFGRLLRNELREGILWRAARYDDGRVGTDFAEHLSRTDAWAGCQNPD